MITKRAVSILTGICGILGTLALVIYFSAPFWLMPLPPPNATVEQVMAFGTKYRTVILWDTWLQQIGSFLSVVFTLALVHLAGTSNRFAGRLTLLVCGVIMALSLAEGTFALSAVQAGDNGHRDAALTCFDMTNVFVHIFLIAPSLFLVMGYALLGTTILPRWLVYTAIIFGILFQVLGVVGLFNNKAILLVIFILNLQNIWTLIVSGILISKKSYSFNGNVTPNNNA
jgi:hypothetical protein